MSEPKPKKIVSRDVALVWGIIVGIIGAIILFGQFLLRLIYGYLLESYMDVELVGYVKLGVYYSFAFAILFGIAFALGTTAIIFFRERRRAYFMLFSAIIGALGFAPSILDVSASGLGNGLVIYRILGVSVWAIVTAFPMFISAILLFISAKQQKTN